MHRLKPYLHSRYIGYTNPRFCIHWVPYPEVYLLNVSQRCREQPPRGARWVSGLVGHFVQTWPDSECSHTVQCLDCSDLNS